MKALFITFFVFFMRSLIADVDYVIFSYNRPMQLYALLESSEKYMTGLHTTHVIFRTSSSSYDKAYTIVAGHFPWVRFHKQSPTPSDDFKQLTLSCIFSPISESPYVLFAVDDMIVTDFVDLNICCKAMEKYKAWGFYLRMGKNITRSYMLRQSNPPPKGKNKKEGFFCWRFEKGRGEWKYPNTTDQTIYRKKDIAEFFYSTDFISPNTLESQWARYADYTGRGLCFEFSKNVNLPLNLVNPSLNRCEHHYSPKKLLEKFVKGFKIDIDAFRQYRNRSPHIDVKPVFIKRYSQPIFAR